MNKKLLPPPPPTLTLSIVIIVSYISPYFTNCWAIGKKDDDDILSIIAPNNMEYTHTHTVIHQSTKLTLHCWLFISFLP